MTWGELVHLEMSEHGETWEDIVSHTPFDFDVKANGWDEIGFTVWTEHRVYGPWAARAVPWVVSVPRNPCPEEVSL